MTVIAIPKILQERLTDDGAKAFVDILDKVENRTQNSVLAAAEDRFEKGVAQSESRLEIKLAQTEAKLETKISQVESRLETKISQVESKLETRIAQVETKLETKIAQVEIKLAQTESRLIGWMFLFWVGQLGAMIGTMMILLRK